MIYTLFESPIVNDNFAANLNADIGRLNIRSFPDGETYLQLLDDVQDRAILIVDSLNLPNDKMIPLIYLCETARSLGAKSIGFVCPYLCYMRQDKIFNPGEGLTSQYFACLLSHYVDWLVTIDPHLHRYKSMSELYSIPAEATHAAPVVANWIKDNISEPFLIGPDSESEQWVSSMANIIGCDYKSLTKKRYGDKQVEITLPIDLKLDQKTPVFVDDIISSGVTMITAIKQLKSMTVSKPYCIGIHAVFNEQTLTLLKEAGAKSVITCNTIPHQTNQIDVTSVLMPVIEQKIN